MLMYVFVLATSADSKICNLEKLSAKQKYNRNIKRRIKGKKGEIHKNRQNHTTKQLKK